MTVSLRTASVLFGTLVALLFGDVEPALAQVVGSDGEPMLFAESSRRRRRRRRRAKQPPPPPPADEGAAGDAEDPGASAGEAAPAEAAEPGAAPEEASDPGPGGEEGGGDVEDNPFASGGEASEEGGTRERTTGGGALRRSDRLEFDERLIKGQGARSGAIYLFKRTPRKLPELVNLRTTYRTRIVDPVLGHGALARQTGATKTTAPATRRSAEATTKAKAPPTKAGEEPAVEPTKAEEETKRRPRRRRRRRRRR